MTNTNHLGFINRYGYSDVHSFRVFEQDGKTFAIEVEKVRAVEPEFHIGGFAAHCSNQDEVWSGQETYDVGSAFEITKGKAGKKKGLWGRKHQVVSHSHIWASEKEARDFLKGHFEDGKLNSADGYHWMWCVETDGKDWYTVCYDCTAKGKIKETFTVLGNGEIVDRCNYYYDYNF